jgi:hypothetical protein
MLKSCIPSEVWDLYWFFTPGTWVSNIRLLLCWLIMSVHLIVFFDFVASVLPDQNVWFAYSFPIMRTSKCSGRQPKGATRWRWYHSSKKRQDILLALMQCLISR